MDIAALKVELAAGHPGTGAYNASDSIAADELNAVNRTTNKATMTASEIMQSIDSTEWGLLSAANKQVVWDVLHIGVVNPFGVEATLIQNAFGGSGVTVTALGAARTNSVSRAVELGLGFVWPGEVNQAKNYHV